MNKFGTMNLNGTIVTDIRFHRIAKVIETAGTEIKKNLLLCPSNTTYKLCLSV